MRAIVTEIEGVKIFFTHQTEEIRPSVSHDGSATMPVTCPAGGSEGHRHDDVQWYTAYKVASQRPKASIHVFTGNRSILGQLALCWSVGPFSR